MKFSRTRIAFAAMLLGLVPPAHAQQDTPTITEAELLHRTQQLNDAVFPADKAPWQRYLADDVLLFDEKGRSMDKAAMLADIEPFPPGYTGSIKVINPKCHLLGNVAIFTYDADETETIFTNNLHARYHETDTWLYRNHLWQIVAGQTLRYYEDPATAAINATLLNDYLGTYQLAPGNTLTVTRTGDKLFATRGAGKPVELLPESPDMFFRAGVEGRRLFHRDATGHVDILIDRRNNEDLLWAKID